MTKRELSIAFQTDKRAQDYIDLAKLVNQYAFDAVTVYCDAPYHPSYGPLLLMAPHIEQSAIGSSRHTAIAHATARYRRADRPSRPTLRRAAPILGSGPWRLVGRPWHHRALSTHRGNARGD